MKEIAGISNPYISLTNQHGGAATSFGEHRLRTGHDVFHPHSFFLFTYRNPAILGTYRNF